MAKCSCCKHLKNKRCLFTGRMETDVGSERYCGAFRPKTNADRIRNMTDEELAEFLDDMAYYCKGRQNETYCSNCRFYFLGECNCVSIGEWLKSEVGCE